MSKISEYLNEHILGEVTQNKAICERFSRDGSVLTIKPEIIVFPRTTNDIRKVARLCWQLAEKGHTLSVTARGFGADATGASIGKGVIVNTTAHLNKVLYLPANDKQKIVHVQPGISCASLNQVLSLRGLAVPAFPESAVNSTVGGALANNSRGPLSGVYGGVGDWVEKLEVVLANGDVIETDRISKHDVNKKIGLQTFEGEIYRKIDGLIEDYEELINTELKDKRYGNSGYGGIAEVKAKDGSMDLTPLFIGSQGTLGIVSEIILKTDYLAQESISGVMVFKGFEEARDFADTLRRLDLTVLEILDGKLYAMAQSQGKKYPFFSTPEDDFEIGAVLYWKYLDDNHRHRNKKFKKIRKLVEKQSVVSLDSETTDETELVAIRDVSGSLYITEETNQSMPPIIDGARVPGSRMEEFLSEINKLETKHHQTLPIHLNVLDETVFIRTPFNLDKVSDKQKMLKLIGDFANVVDVCGGDFIYDASEGRVKANASYSLLDDRTQELYKSIRNVFDPFSTLNPGVKQQVPFKELVDMLRSSYDVSDRAHFAPTT